MLDLSVDHLCDLFRHLHRGVVGVAHSLHGACLCVGGLRRLLQHLLPLRLVRLRQSGGPENVTLLGAHRLRLAQLNLIGRRCQIPSLSRAEDEVLESSYLAVDAPDLVPHHLRVLFNVLSRRVLLRQV